MTNEGMLCALENRNKVILITIDEWKVQFFRSYLLSVCFLTYNYFLQGMGDKLVNNASLQGESLQKKEKPRQSLQKILWLCCPGCLQKAKKHPGEAH